MRLLTDWKIPANHADRENPRRWMQAALALARRAQEEGEVPIGCVVVRNGLTIGAGWNRTQRLGDPTCHAEIVALRRAAAITRNFRLSGAIVVCTLEPCLMCMGAMLEARVSTLIFGASDPMRGSIGLLRSASMQTYPLAELTWTGGVEERECRELLQQYFAQKR